MTYPSLRQAGRLTLLAALLLSLSACGTRQPSADIEPTVPAAGTLTFRGAPLKYYQVMFFPSDRRPAAGTTDEEGRFVLGTNDTGDGAVAGSHRVKVVYVGPPNTNPEAGITDFSPPPPPEIKVPPKYRNIDTSGLTIEIPDDGDTNLQIDLE